MRETTAEELKRIPGLRKTVRFLSGKPIHDARDYLLARMPRGSVCAEIGVHRGQFSRRIMRQIKPAMLHLIDPWQHNNQPPYDKTLYGGLGDSGQLIMDARYEAVKKTFDREIRRGRVVIHRRYSSDLAQEFNDGYFDWIYMDSNPQYEFVRQDLELYYPKIKPGGFITGDNYAMEGWWNNEAQKAVDEFVTQRAELTLLVKETQFMIKKPL